MKTFMGILFFVPLLVLRLVLIMLGLVAVPISMLGDGKYRTPWMWKLWANAVATPAAYTTSTWKKIWWWAVRNPTTGLTSLLKQPIPEVQPNPDRTVRGNTGGQSDYRWMQSGIFWEFWYLRRVGDKYFEFRIGWKFVDGNEEFFPTIQCRLGH